MKKIVGSGISLVGLFIGVILLNVWHALDIVGRIMTMLDSPRAFDHLIDWLVIHPRLTFDVGPWVLILVSIASLTLLHSPLIRGVIANIGKAPLTQGQSDAAPVEAPLKAISPPIGSLRFVVGRLRLDIKEDFSQIAGQIEAELFNDSDFMISFHVITAGNINGMAFDYNKVEFDGYSHPKQPLYIVSNRIVGIPLSHTTDLREPSLTGIFEYDIVYKNVQEPANSRRTAKGVKIQHWYPMERKQAGTTGEIQTRILLYNEIEE